MASREHRPRSHRVALTADDDEFFRMAIRSILVKQVGMDDVIEAGSFDDALEKLAEAPNVSIALFDLQMPGIKSAANLKTIRESFPSIKVAVVSASQNWRDVMSALNAGVHGYVPKSLGATELGHAVRMILQGTIFVPSSLADSILGASDMGMPTFSARTEGSLLTPRQREVLGLLVEGKSNKEIARALQLGEGTVKIHMAALFRNLDVSNRASAAVIGAKILAVRSEN